MVSDCPFIFKSFSPLINSLVTTKSTNYNWYKRHFHVPQFFQFPSKVEVFIFLFTFFQFYIVVSQESKVHNFAISLFLFFYFFRLSLGLVFWPRLDDPFVRQSPIGVYVWHFLRQVLGCAYTICSYGEIKISCTIPCPQFFLGGWLL